MFCDSTKCNPVPECIVQLTIGQIEDLNTAVVVKIENIATDYIVSLSATSDGSGYVSIPMNEPSNTFWNTAGIYKVSILPTDSMQPKQITLGGMYVYSLIFSIEQLNANYVITNWNLELADVC